MDFNNERLAGVHSFGCESCNLSEGGSVADHIERILDVRKVHRAVDCVGFESWAREIPEVGDSLRSAHIAIHPKQFSAITNNTRSPNAPYPCSQLASAAIVGLPASEATRIRKHLAVDRR